MKIPFTEIESIIRESLEPAKAQEILKKIEIVSEELKNEPKQPKSKNQYSIILIDTENKITEMELTGLVIKLPAEDDVNLILGKIGDATKAFNESKKGKKKMAISTVVEAAERVKRKYFKEVGINIVTKNLIQVIKSDNKLV